MPNLSPIQSTQRVLGNKITVDQGFTNFKTKAVKMFSKENAKKLAKNLLTHGVVLGAFTGASIGIEEAINTDEPILIVIKEQDSALYQSVVDLLKEKDASNDKFFSIGKSEKTIFNLIDLPTEEAGENGSFTHSIVTSLKVDLQDDFLSFKELEEVEEKAYEILLQREEILNLIMNLFSNNFLLPKIKNLTAEDTYTLNILNKDRVVQNIFRRDAIMKDLGIYKIHKNPIRDRDLFVDRNENKLHCITQPLTSLTEDCKITNDTFLKIFNYKKDRLVISGGNEGKITCDNGEKYISKTDYLGLLIPQGCRIMFKSYTENIPVDLGSQIEDLTVLFTHLLELSDESVNLVIIILIIGLVIISVTVSIIFMILRYKEKLSDTRLEINIFRNPENEELNPM